MKISLFNNSMLGYILPITVKEILERNSTHIFKSTIQTDNLHSIASHPGIFQKNLLLIIRDLCRSLQPCIIFSTTFGEKLDFTTANHIKEYINFLWTYFLMIGWLETLIENRNFSNEKSFLTHYTYCLPIKALGR